ncbi:MAG: hypothetical protein Q9169_000080 [Polycauliona sp. 2 TL-2023]
MQREIHGNGNDEAAWSRTVAKLDKDTAELYELIRKRIDADPFDALFGQNPLISNRARSNWWGLGGRNDGDSKTSEQPPSTRREPAKVTKTEDVKQQHVDRNSEHMSDTRQDSTPSSQDRSTDSSSLHEEHEIDFITMRKIPKGSMARTPGHTHAFEQKSEITIKPFGKAVSEKLSGQPPENGDAPKPNLTASRIPYIRSDPSPSMNKSDWLSQEGFGSKKESQPDLKPAVSETVHETLPTRIESALERRMRTKGLNDKVNGAHAKLKYDPKENQTDDVDLLRASDIRAASGAAIRSRRHAELQKNENRMKLEADFAALEKMEAIGLEWKKELAAAKERIQEFEAKRRNKANDAHLEREIQAQKAAMEALEMRRANDSTTGTVVHSERGEGDMASNVHEFAQRGRWYKRKAPHAAMAEDGNSVQVAKARSLIREIRGIYEDTYGAIDAQHRQLEKATSDLEEQKPSTSLNGNEGSLAGNLQRNGKAMESNKPLSTKEKISTMLQQLLDDSRYLQKFLRTPELTSQSREEIFHRNRSMQNASEAIAEALYPGSSEFNKRSLQHSSIPEKRTATNEKHVGPSSMSLPGDAKELSTVYNVLAYDPSTQLVTTAEMSSSGDSLSERKLSLSEALSSLTDPVKFLPQLTELQSRGFEIVSSDTNILVLKKNNKTRASEPDLQAAIDNRGRRKINPIDGTTTQTGTIASPEGIASHGVEPSARTVEGGGEAESKSSGYKVRREEDVFSASGNRWEDRQVGERSKIKSRYRRIRRRRRTTKRMLWVGLWTAGCCYAVGAITELLRA